MNFSESGLDWFVADFVGRNLEIMKCSYFDYDYYLNDD